MFISFHQTAVGQTKLVQNSFGKRKRVQNLWSLLFFVTYSQTGVLGRMFHVANKVSNRVTKHILKKSMIPPICRSNLFQELIIQTTLPCNTHGLKRPYGSKKPPPKKKHSHPSCWDSLTLPRANSTAEDNLALRPEKHRQTDKEIACWKQLLIKNKHKNVAILFAIWLSLFLECLRCGNEKEHVATLFRLL